MELLKANPGKYSYASPGYGTSPHVAVERPFKLAHEFDIGRCHPVWRPCGCPHLIKGKVGIERGPTLMATPCSSTVLPSGSAFVMRPYLINR